MACPVDGRYSAELFDQAMTNLSLWEAGYCSYGAPLGELVVGSIVYSAFALNIFLRTGSLMIPFVLALILGGTIFGQVLGVINTLAGLVILFSAPIVATGLVMMLESRR